MKDTMSADHTDSPCYAAEDWQAQLEEVLALQSIFADDFRVTHIPGHNAAGSSATSSAAPYPKFAPNAASNSSSILSSTSGNSNSSKSSSEDLEQLIESLLGSKPPVTAVDELLTCETLVHVGLPAGQLQIVLDMRQQQQTHAHMDTCSHSSSSCAHEACTSPSSNSSSSSMQMPFGPPISYLPPFCVQLTLPRTYPSSEQTPPKVRLQACWLSHQHEQQLQEQLQQLWLEQGPGPICFTWLDYLKNDALEAVGIVKDLVLQPQPHQQQQQQQQQVVSKQQEEQQQLQERASAAPTSSSSSGASSEAYHTVLATSSKRGAAARTGEGRGSLSAAAAPFSPGEATDQRQQRQQSRPRQQQMHVKPAKQDGASGSKQPPSSKQTVKQKQQQQQQQGRPGGRQPGRQQAALEDRHQQRQNTQQQETQLGKIVDEQQQQQEVEQAAAGLINQQQQQIHAVEQLAVQLLRYSAAQEAEAFRESTQTCLICFDQVPGADCLQLPDCGHFYCITCLKSHAAAQMEQGAVENMRCPEPSCRRPFQPYVIKELLGEAGYTKWEDMLLQRTLDKMEDVVYCPRCDTVCIEDADHCAQCSKCLYVFCSFCSDSWHPGSECLDPHERLRILERRKKATGAGDKRYEMDLVNQLMNLKYLNSNSRKCPSCGMATIKNEGCNKMTCVYCGSNWCWKCQQVIEGYDHFRESRCNMFDQEEINRWNAMMWANERAREVEMGQFAMQVRVQNNPEVRLCRCPVCGQENMREGKNNLLRCWSCNCHFCYSCRSWLRGKVGQHYVGPGAKCKQHGD